MFTLSECPLNSISAPLKKNLRSFNLILSSSRSLTKIMKNAYLIQKICALFLYTNGINCYTQRVNY